GHEGHRFGFLTLSSLLCKIAIRMNPLVGDRGCSRVFSNNRTTPPFRRPDCDPNRRISFSRTSAYFLSVVVKTVVLIVSASSAQAQVSAVISGKVEDASGGGVGGISSWDKKRW